METRKNLERKAQPNLTDAVARTERVLKGLQTRLAERAVESGEPGGDEVRDDDLERELLKYFERGSPGTVVSRGPRTAEPGAAGTREAPGGAEGRAGPVPALEEIRRRVIEGVVERVLKEFDSPASPLMNEVVERLIERVVMRLTVHE